MRFLLAVCLISQTAFIQALDFFFRKTSTKPTVIITHHLDDEVTCIGAQLQADDYSETIVAGYYPDVEEPYSCEHTHCLDEKKVKYRGKKAQEVLEHLEAVWRKTGVVKLTVNKPDKQS